MATITKTKKSDKVTNKVRVTKPTLARLIRSSFEYGYKNVSISEISEDYYRISTWDLVEDK